MAFLTAITYNFTLYILLATRYSRCRAHFNIFSDTVVPNARLRTSVSIYLCVCVLFVCGVSPPPMFFSSKIVLLRRSVHVICVPVGFYRT